MGAVFERFEPGSRRCEGAIAPELLSRGRRRQLGPSWAEKRRKWRPKEAIDRDDRSGQSFEVPARVGESGVQKFSLCGRWVL